MRIKNLSLILFLALCCLIIQSGCKEDSTHHVYRSRTGHRLSLRLQDGSRVILNSNSVLKVPYAYNKGSRKVILSGAAFFEVAPGSGSQFVVESPDINAGTPGGSSFYIRAYPQESGRQIEVTAGKLKVRKSYHSDTDNKEEILSPGEMVMLNRSVDLMEKETYEIRERQSWLSGRLKFTNVSFNEAIRILEDWYGVPFEITPGKERQGNFSADFSNEPLEKVLQVFCSGAGCSFKMEEEKVVLGLN